MSCPSALSTDASGKTVSPVNGAPSATASDSAVPADDSSDVSCPSALSTDASGKTVPPVGGAAAGTTADATPIDDVGVFVIPFDDTAGKHWCQSPLQPQVLLKQVPLPSAPTAAVPPTGRTSTSPFFPTEATQQPRHHRRKKFQKGGSCRALRHLLTEGFPATVAAAVAAAAPVRREEKDGNYVDVDEYHRRETFAAVAAAAAACHHRETIAAVAAAAAACHPRETTVAAAAAAVACHRRETSVAVAAAATEACHHRETSVAVAAAAAEACHRREISVAVTAAAAEACHRREIPYGHPFVGLRLPRPPRPENHGQRQEYEGSMDVPGTGGE